MNKKYYVGLDVGSNSAGWAVTDDEFNLKRIKGKDAWGARLFDEAEDSKTRRGFRSYRRRLERVKYRIYLLDTYIFGEEINKIDDTFFLRLKESKNLLEDKSENNKTLYPLFKEKTLEKEFYKKYPTIYHLRKAQLDGNEESLKDPRLVYLTIHHMMKKRGNFLHEGSINFNELDDDLINGINEAFEENINGLTTKIFDREKVNKITEILLSNENSKTKISRIKEAINCTFEEDNSSAILDMFSRIIAGGKVSLSKVIEDLDENVEIDFKSNFDEKESEIEAAAGELMSIILVAKEIYDYIYVKKILGQGGSLSEAMIRVYNEHKHDLQMLKKILKKADGNDKNRTLYRKVFLKDIKDVSYSKSYDLFITNPSKMGVDELNKVILGVLKEIKDEAILNSNEYKDLCAKAEAKSLLKRISDVKGSQFPKQLNENELKIIIDNASKYHPFLSEKKEMILSIFNYKVNYYEGPLNTNSKYSNVVIKEGKEGEKIFPWNKDEIIDEAKTKEKFYNSLTNNCTYLVGENVLPLESITYRDYINLDRLNKIVINGTKISQEVKLDIFNNLINQNSKTTISMIKKYLMARYEIYSKDRVTISGIEENDPFIATTRFALKNTFDLNDVEIIKKIDREYVGILTVYADAKKDGISYIKSKNPSLNETQLNALRRVSSKKRGRLSYKLLRGLKHFDDNGVAVSILELLIETTQNLNEILVNYGFDGEIEKHNIEVRGDKTKTQQINEIKESIPAIMRRSVIQATKIVDEIVKFSKGVPSKIILEVTRSNDFVSKKQKMSSEKLGDKNRINSRSKELSEFIAAFLKDCDESMKGQAEEVKAELEKFKEDIRLKGRALYLYFKQIGIDLYSGEKIDIEDIFSGDKYDLDHIIPQSKIKDDSLDNLVLVSKNINQKEKKDIYPLPESIRNRMASKWKYLKEKGAISSEKYNRLVRVDELSEDELNDFVARQLNVVNYANKILRDIFKIKYPNTEVIFSKAENVSYIRKKYDIVKIRDLNDAHHAVDAYLNIVSGVLLTNYYNVSRHVHKNLKSDDKENKKYNIERTTDYLLEKNNLVEKIVNTSYKHSALITYREKYVDGAFYDQTIYKRGAKNDLVPLKTSNPKIADVSKYGGYNNLSVSYFLAGKDEKGKEVIVSVPIMYDKLYKDRPDFKERLEKYNKVKLSELSYEPIYFGTIKMNGGTYLFRNGNLKQATIYNGNQVYLSKESTIYLFNLIRLLNKEYECERAKKCEANELFIKWNIKEEDTFIVSKSANLKLFNELLQKSSDAIYNQYSSKIKEFVDNNSAGDFVDKKLFDQISLLVEFLGYLAKGFKDVDYKPSKSILLSKGNLIVKDTITGL